MRTWLSRLGLLFGSAVVSGLLLEGAVLLIFGEQPKFPRHVVGAPFGVRINEPGSTYRHKSADVTVWFRINGQGLRSDHDFAYAKPAGLKRIVVLGDSYTVGYEVSGEETYSAVLEQDLNRRGIPVQVLNAAVSGSGNAEEAVYLERELLKYDPDLVVVGFYGNDLVDNVRSDLFRLENGRLVEGAPSYVPAGRLGNFLNTNWFFNWLSERSNAFVLLKERATDGLKRRAVSSNVKALERAEAKPAGGEAPYEERLAAAIFERVFATLRGRGGTLVIASIPTYRQAPDRLVDTFPTALFDVGRPGLAYVSGKDVLDPYVGRRPLYWLRSHFHWTPFAHERVGQALAERIAGHGLLSP